MIIILNTLPLLLSCLLEDLCLGLVTHKSASRVILKCTDRTWPLQHIIALSLVVHIWVNDHFLNRICNAAKDLGFLRIRWWNAQWVLRLVRFFFSWCVICFWAETSRFLLKRLLLLLLMLLLETSQRFLLLRFSSSHHLIISLARLCLFDNDLHRLTHTINLLLLRLRWLYNIAGVDWDLRSFNLGCYAGRIRKDEIVYVILSDDICHMRLLLCKFYFWIYWWAYALFI